MKRKKDKIKDHPMYEELKAHLYSGKSVLGKDSPFSTILQTMVDTILEGEVESHLSSDRKKRQPNKRNGYTKKRVISDQGELEIHTPRDRMGTFEPELIEKRQTQLSSGLDKQILALYAQGNSVEDVRRLLSEMFGVEISAGKISMITDKVLPEITAWKNRPLEAFYPIVYLDAIHFKVRHEGKYSSRAFYTVYSVDWQGQRDLLGMYVNGQEGAHKWGLVLEDLKRRGVQDILVICTDNLSGFTESIVEVYPQSIIQKCIVHQIRNSLKYVEEKDRRKVAKGLKAIYSATTEQDALIALESFKQQWSKPYKYIIKQWEQNWEELMAFMQFSSPIRRMIYTTNPVEALHRIIRKIIKGKAAWVSEQALQKQIFLSLMYNEKSWRKKAYNWKSIQREIMELYPERIPK